MGYWIRFVPALLVAVAVAAANYNSSVCTYACLQHLITCGLMIRRPHAAYCACTVHAAVSIETWW